MNKTYKIIGLTLALMLVLAGMVAAQDYTAAPELEKQVQSGEIEPVSERLPKTPLVEEVDQEGKYGGELQTYMSAANGAEYIRLFIYEPHLTFETQTGFAEPKEGLCKDWEASDDNTTFTFHLREGLKWSDGDDFTTEDVRFWFEDMANNEEFSPGGVGGILRDPEGNAPELIIVDETTFKFKFDTAFGTFLTSAMTAWNGDFYAPAHYLKPHHKDYASEEELQKKMDEAGFDEWKNYYGEISNDKKNGDIPMMTPWTWDTEPMESATTIVKRNPYYYKVDQYGNQLPYIDKMIIREMTDPTVAITGALNGDYDLCARNINTLDNKSLFAQSINEGKNLRFVENRSTESVEYNLQFNLTKVGNEDKRELFQTPKFRKAISHCINREEMIELLTYGMGEPSQTAPLEASAFYHEGYANAYLEYDPEKTRRMLDELTELGLDEKTSDGWRKLKGEKLNITIVGVESVVDAMETITGYMKEVGIDTEVRTVGWKKYMQGQKTGERDAVVYWGDGGLEVLQDPRFYIPENASFSGWAPRWAQWYNDSGGEEPIAEIKEMYEWYNNAVSTANVDEQKKWMKKIFDRHEENLYLIGIMRPPSAYTVVDSRLKNVPEWWWSSWQLPHPVSSRPWKWFFDM